MSELKYRWKICVKDFDGEGVYLGPNGEADEDSEFLGTRDEAFAEGDRRADIWEHDPEHGLVTRVEMERRGLAPEAPPKCYLSLGGNPPEMRLEWEQPKTEGDDE